MKNAFKIGQMNMKLQKKIHLFLRRCSQKTKPFLRQKLILDLEISIFEDYSLYHSL